MKKIYLVATVIGAIVPFFFFFQFIQSNGVNLPGFISSLFVNGAAGGFSADLLISSFVFWIFMFQRRKMSNAPKPWLFIALNLGIGLSCALPAYLYAIEKLHNSHRA
jgi:Terpene cyclase DEP1